MPAQQIVDRCNLGWRKQLRFDGVDAYFGRDGASRQRVIAGQHRGFMDAQGLQPLGQLMSV